MFENKIFILFSTLFITLILFVDINHQKTPSDHIVAISNKNYGLYRPTKKTTEKTK